MEELIEKMKARKVGQVVRRLGGEKVDKTNRATQKQNHLSFYARRFS
jgi:hypothetical protein